MSSHPGYPLHIGVINPYALAQVKVGHAIQWQNVPNPPALLERLLGHPYKQLFDPKYHSPLYAGLKYNEDHKTMVRDETDPVFTARSMEEALVSVLKRTGDIHLRHDEMSEPHPRQHVAGLITDLAAKSDEKIPLEALERIKKVASERRFNVIPRIDPRLIEKLLSGFDWIDPGHFFTDATSPLDVNQGALGDCYFVAPLASVAWARPFSIAQRTRQTDPTGLFATPGVVDLVLFWNGSAWDRIQVNELLPLQPPSDTYVYARSDDLTETWPAVYEKAYAMWRTGDTSNFPNYSPISGGDPVAAAVALTGLPGTYYGTARMTAYNIWQTVRGHSLSYKTFDPMVAWTYSSSAAAPTPIDYNSATIVANHAYSILGWDYHNGQEYIVLRNPWGYHEATLNVESGTWFAYDGSFWYPVPLSSHGVFGLRADTFQQYFAGFGVVTGTDTYPAS